MLAVLSIRTGRVISLMDLVGNLVRGQMPSGDGFISTFREHFGLWAVTKFGVTRRLTVRVVIKGHFAMMIRNDSCTAKALAMYTPTLYHIRYAKWNYFCRRWQLHRVAIAPRYVFHSPFHFYRTFGTSDDRSTSFWLAAGSWTLTTPIARPASLSWCYGVSCICVLCVVNPPSPCKIFLCYSSYAIFMCFDVHGAWI